MSSLPWAALSPSWPIKCLSCLLPGTTLKSRLLSVTEVDQAEAPGPASLGIPTPLLLLPRTGLSVSASLNGICCTEDKVVPLFSPPAPPQASKAFACVHSAPWRAGFFPEWRPFQGSAPFPRVFLLGGSMRLSG